MLDSWRNLRRILAVQLGSVEDVRLTAIALQKLRFYLPNSAIALMTSPAGKDAGVSLAEVDDLLVYESDNFTSLNAEREMTLISKLRQQAFDAAVIFTPTGESPYPLAYICYLAGISISVGRSLEFGGGVLSHCVKPDDDNLLNEYLLLIELFRRRDL